MNIYVAGKWQDREEISKIMHRLRSIGHIITVDWTNHVNPEEQSILMEWAVRDIEGVRKCDLFFGIFVKDFIYTGAVAELGAAIISNKKCWVIGQAISHCIFLHHPLVTIMPDLETAFKLLDIVPEA